jgi:hypothetical protein
MSGELPIRGGSQVNCKDIYFNSGGDIYLYSYINKLKSYILCKIADIANGTSGMMSVIGSTASILISSGAGESGGLMNLAAFGAGSVYTKTVSIEFPTGQKARIKSISVLFRNKVAGTSGLSFRVDTSLDGGSLVQATPEISAITKLKYIYYKNNNGTALGDFNTLSLCLQWRESTGTSTAPIIDKIEVDFEPISL